MKVSSLPVQLGPTTSEGAAAYGTQHERAQGDPSGAAALTLSVRPQGLLEEEDFDVALLQSGTCSPV